ncbi:MAG: hypothetical protein WAO98_04575 [Alphaproteobacteria bacterium]
MLRHIAWFTEAPIAPTNDGSLASENAEASSRCLIPARELEKLGVHCSVFGNLSDADPTHVSKHLQKLNSDIVVISPFSGPSMLKLARAAKHLGCYVVADFGHENTLLDDHLKLADIADQCVAATSSAAKAVMAKCAVPTLVLPDCDERSTGKSAPDLIARMWMDIFNKLKLRPPACANSNIPA